MAQTMRPYLFLREAAMMAARPMTTLNMPRMIRVIGKVYSQLERKCRRDMWVSLFRWKARATIRIPKRIRRPLATMAPI